MKYLLLAATLLINCNPFTSINMMTGGAVTNAVVDVITTDLVLTTIIDSTQEKENRVISVPTFLLNKFLDEAVWLNEYKYKDGYACLCAYFEANKTHEFISLKFHIKPIDHGGYKWGYWRFEITDEEWDSIKCMIPERVCNTDLFFTFEK
jgi:hypothetical protein